MRACPKRTCSDLQPDVTAALPCDLRAGALKGLGRAERPRSSTADARSRGQRELATNDFEVEGTAVFAQALDVELERRACVRDRFIDRVALGMQARETGRVHMNAVIVLRGEYELDLG